MKNATEGTIKEVTYWWPRPGTEKPLEKRTFFCKGRWSKLRSRLLQVVRVPPRPEAAHKAEVKTGLY
jgi:hypothetical protein